MIIFFLKKEEPAQVGTPIHHTLLYAKMFCKMGLAGCNATTDSPRESRTVQRESDSRSDSCTLALYNERAIETAGSQATEVDADLVTEEFELDFPNETHENNSDTESEAPG